MFVNLAEHNNSWISQVHRMGKFTELCYNIVEEKFYILPTFVYVFDSIPPSSLPEYIHLHTLAELVHFKDRFKIESIPYQIKRGISKWQFTVRSCSTSKRCKYLHFKAQVLYDSTHRPENVIFWVQDVTYYYAQRQKLKRYAQIAQHSSQSIIILDAQQKIVWVNKRFEKLSGYRLSEIKGKYPGDFLRGELTDKQTSTWIKVSLDEQKRVRTELQHYRKDGQTYWVSVEILPLYNKKGKLKKFLCLMTDITEQKKMEGEKNELIVQLIDNNKNLEQFSYIVSHNLRAPVARITGLTHLFNKEQLHDPVNLKIINFLQDSAQQLDQVIKDLGLILSLRHPEKNSFTNVEISKVVDEVIKELNPVIRKTNALITTDFEEQKVIFGIENHLKNILIQLISNSVKFIRQDKQPHIHISTAKMPNNYICLRVSDNGLGIDLKHYGNQLFTIYKRFHLQFEGRGIGLYIVRTLVESMNGYIEVESEEWYGTTFSIYLRKK
ncbi:MAG: PAS domain-containing sensor histidine kinase [Cytophagales bacterium]|nr:PAS domain-containing sensor histidine kinase [Cytophagales bacterium]MDW8383391.1 PAS domain-containing sensor histidine kinase [Flammeovirgaceae bacterium]